jgi:hypothetical protein
MPLAMMTKVINQPVRQLESPGLALQRLLDRDIKYAESSNAVDEVEIVVDGFESGGGWMVNRKKDDCVEQVDRGNGDCAVKGW